MQNKSKCDRSQPLNAATAGRYSGRGLNIRRSLVTQPSAPKSWFN